METTPEGTAQTYIFLVNNQDIALNIVMSGYQALCLVQEDGEYIFPKICRKNVVKSRKSSAKENVTPCTARERIPSL